jgi:alanyl-tRNA synthetase
MQVRSGNQIREMFLKFFEEKGHRRVHSSSLVPANDPTLLFTNAGMNQFKDVFLGLEQRDYNRATTSQKCVRAGGKHNDLENVGFTRRHHTFFEMLGNFSFGDYFKRGAIAYAWELVTAKKWLGIPKDRLYVTIFKGEGGVPRDEEAHAFWLEQGVPAERIFEMGMKDNFWQMGDTGPCGPCSEIFYDMGIEASESGKDLPFGQDEARYVEIWNLVFMQFDRSAQGELTLLPKPSIDTGAGLERMAAVLQNKISNFETDLFVPLIEKAAELTHASGDLVSNPSLRIIADHARAATFLISDGVLPANEGRGYVLRKILRRGIRHGYLLGQDQPFMRDMVFAVRDEMEGAYPELKESADRISKVVEAEERQFARVIEVGSVDLDSAIANAKLRFDAFPEDFRYRSGSKPKLPGDQAFHLYETYGLPLDFMVDAARDAGIEFDLTGFEAARAEEQARARASWKGGTKATASPAYRALPKTVFEGYTQLASTNCEVLAIVRDGLGVPAAAVGEEVEVVLDHTSFYADSGGQVGDHGWLRSDDHNTVIADVLGSTQPVQGVRAHRVRLKQPIALGMRVDTVVDAEFRNATRRNHTGTHLLHAALRQVLGTHVKQAGSLVAPSRLRFDFSHFTAVADEELQDIEDTVNRQVLANTKVDTLVDVPIDVAVNEYKAMALFGEKYGERVRVVKIGDFSTELCGGTHTGATGEIGLLKLTGESSVSSGVRRVEAVSGMGALDEFRRGYEAAQLASQVASTSDADPAEALRQRFTAQEDEIKRLRRELDQARMKSAVSAVASAANQAVEVKGVKVLSQRVAALDRGQMRTLVDNLRNKLGSGVVVLGSAADDGKVALIVGVTKDLTGRVQAGKIVGEIAKRVGGSGGGRPDLAEAGGKDASQLDAALAGAPEVVGNLLG